MIRPAFRLAALLAAGGGLVVCQGCQGSISNLDNNGSGGSSGGPGGHGSGGNSGGGPDGGTSPDAPVVPPPTPPISFDLSCDQPNLGSPVLRLLNRAEFERTLTDIFPQVAGQWTNSLPAVTVSGYGFDNDSSSVVGPQQAQAILDTATAVATAIVGTPLATILPCASSANTACAQQFITKYGKLLFRRTLTAAEQTTYTNFFNTALAASDFKTAIKWTAIGLMQSPNALYRSEIGTAGSDGTRQLSAYEQATELAYTYTGSAPSSDLLTQADSGNLGDLVALAKTLVATTRGQEVLQHFFEGWLDYTRVASIEKQNVAQFSSVRSDMVQETRAFVSDVVVQKKGGLGQLLTAPTTYPSAALASYYGFPAPGSDYASVARPSGMGTGILAQGSVLATHSTANSSSPTERGLLIFQHLLCETKPQVPANVPPIPAPDPGHVTTRYRYETSHATGGCALCHTRFDPIGFGFEHYDEGGRYRADENGLTINSASNVPGPDGTALFQFNGEEDLMSGLVQQKIIYQCFAAHLATYAFGTGDSCLGSSRVNDLQAGTLGITDYYTALAAEPHFTRRASQ